MNVGWSFTRFLLVISLSVSCITCIYPHHLGSRLRPQRKSSKTEESQSGSRSSDTIMSTEVRTRNRKGTQYCFVSHCEHVKCNRKCISISKRSTGRPVPASIASASKAKKSMFLKEEKRSSVIITVGSFLKLVTLLKQIPLIALVTSEGGSSRRFRHLTKMQRMTRVQ